MIVKQGRFVEFRSCVKSQRIHFSKIAMYSSPIWMAYGSNEGRSRIVAGKESINAD